MGEREKSKELLHTIHSDVCGPMSVTGLMGERYFTTFIDEASGRIGISLLSPKSEVLERFKQYKAKVELETGKKVKFLRYDGRGVYTANPFRSYLAEQGITPRITPSYTQEHNGIAERAYHTIMDMVRCMLSGSGLGKEFWGLAALTAIHIINRLPSTAHENKTPFESWFASQPSICHLRVFGCIAYRHIPAQRRRKVDPKGQRCRMIWYKEESGSRVYLVYDENTKQVLITRDLIFDETATQDRTDSLHSPATEIETHSSLQSSEINQESLQEKKSERVGQTPTEEEDEETIERPLTAIDPNEEYSSDSMYLKRHSRFDHYPYMDSQTRWKKRQHPPRTSQ